MERVVLSFFIYSFMGWLFESLMCSLVNENHFINRGFLLGPCCPIYGTGAILSLTAFAGITSPGRLFLMAVAMSACLEYMTGYLLEKIFHDRWWDYSDYPFQLHGRICLYGLVMFGVSNVAIHFYIQPILNGYMDRFAQHTLWTLAVILVIAFLADLIAAVAQLTGIDYPYRERYGNLEERSNQIMGEMSDYLVERCSVLILEFKKSFTDKDSK